MSIYSDFVSFVDGNSKVPYYVDGSIYVPKPNIFSERFSFEMKEYYHSYNRYYVGIPSSNFVRPIFPSEFNLVLGLYNTYNEKDIAKKVQLSFEF